MSETQAIYWSTGCLRCCCFFGRSYRFCEGTYSSMSFFLSQVKITKKHPQKTQKKTHIKPERLSKTQYTENAHTENAKIRITPAKPRNDTCPHKKTATRQITVQSLGDLKLQPFARIPQTRRAKRVNTLCRHHHQTSLRKAFTCLLRIYPGPQLPHPSLRRPPCCLSSSSSLGPSGDSLVFRTSVSCYLEALLGERSGR